MIQGSSAGEENGKRQTKGTLRYGTGFHGLAEEGYSEMTDAPPSWSWPAAAARP